jgi:predicted dehydrogenase
MVKIGVIGTGSMGILHARIISEIPNAELAGVVDTNKKRAEDAASRFNCPVFENHMSMIKNADALVISVPTLSHYHIARDCLKNGRDILIEKPITSTLKEAESLISLAEEKGLIIQVGHLERFNSGLSMMSSMINTPLFIESRRLSPFLGRGIDVDVTLDLMIHDIDIILSLIKSDIADIRATGSRVLTDTIDIAYAWLEFKDGCIAESVASRMANEKVRELKVFQQNSYLNLNYLTQEVSCYRKTERGLVKESKKAQESEPLKEQMISFIESIVSRKQPVVSGVEGMKALDIALRVSEMINNDNTQ